MVTVGILDDVRRTRRFGAEAEATRWRGSTAYSVGIEEEVMLLDPGSWRLDQRCDEILAHLSPGTLHDHAGPETHQAALELSTDPHATVPAAVAQLSGLRGRLARALEEPGLTACAAGTHPMAVWQETVVSPSRRYEKIRHTMRALAFREPTFALHIHVGVGDPEDAIRAMNRLRAHLPVLLAVSGNSPYWQGRDSGFVSARTLIFGAFPRTGIPRCFDGYADWRATVETLVLADAIPEPTFLWWDIRPQPRFGTVEVRIMDAQTTTEATAALAALVQSVARLELEQGFAPEQLVRADEVLAENRFLAARDGMQAELIDPRVPGRRPARDLLDELLAAARPHADALGCGAELAGVEALAEQPGYERQRRSAAGSDLRPVVAAMEAAFDGSRVAD